MGLAVRIIPTLLHKNGQLVKGRGFDTSRVVGAALQAARIHSARQVDELLIFDVCGVSLPDFSFVDRLTEVCFVPVTYGGGVRGSADVRELLENGADRVSVNRLFREDPNMVAALAARYGSQAISVCLDVGSGPEARGEAVYAAQRAEGVGAGEIILQSIERDGTMGGYDLGLIEQVAKAVSIPVVASGGCSGYGDMKAAIDAGASAVAAGALFQFTGSTPYGAAEYLNSHGVEVRL